MQQKIGTRFPVVGVTGAVSTLFILATFTAGVGKCANRIRAAINMWTMAHNNFPAARPISTAVAKLPSIEYNDRRTH